MNNSAKNYLYNISVSDSLTGIVAFLYIMISSYLGWRIWISIGRILHPSAKPFYWLFYGFLVVSYFASDLKDLNDSGSKFFKMVTIYSLSTTLYLFITVAITDLIIFTDSFLHFIPLRISTSPQYSVRVMVTNFVLTSAMLIYGFLNARIPAVRYYDLSTPNRQSPRKNLRIAMLSDIHINSTTTKKSLKKMVALVNSSKPDIVLMAGDIIDQDVRLLKQKTIESILAKFKAPFGVFGVLGNHECFGNCCDDIVNFLASVKVKIIRDSYIKVADSFYIVGRDDKTIQKITGSHRKSIQDILSNTDERLPRILVDHQPIDLKEAEENNIDLQLSGHTHAGQLFPLQVITKKIYGISSGHKNINSLGLIVSSGFGFWGPPFRIGNRPEVVVIDVKSS